MKKALISGISGQVGSYMAEYLLDLGYEVHGIDRRKSVSNHKNIEDIKNKITLHEADLTDSASIENLVKEGQFHSIYNLAAQSHVKVSESQPYLTMQVNTVGVLNILEGIKKFSNYTRLYQASTSEQFGSSKPPQNETTVFNPRSVYGVSKLAAFHLVKHYREGFNLQVQSGIMFNTEAKRRSNDFLTQKVAQWVRSYSDSYSSKDHPALELGNMYSYRDWTFVKDSIRAIYRICNQTEISNTWNKKEYPNEIVDYTFGSGKSYTVKEFLQRALEIEFGVSFQDRFVFQGTDLNEVLLDKSRNRVIMTVSKKYYRNAEVDYLQCDYSKIKKDLSWEPEYDLDDIIRDMLGK